MGGPFRPTRPSGARHHVFITPTVMTGTQEASRDKRNRPSGLGDRCGSGGRI